MKIWLLPAAAAAITLVASAATAQPYGYYGSYYDRPAYGYDWDSGRYDYRGLRDSDRDGIPDRAEWGRDRDHDGRPDQWDRYDNRRHRHHHQRYDAWRRYDRGPYYNYYYDYGYRY